MMEKYQYNADELKFKKLNDALKIIENKSNHLKEHLINAPKNAISEIAHVKLLKATIDLIDFKTSGADIKVLNEGFESFYSSLKASV